MLSDCELIGTTLLLLALIFTLYRNINQCNSKEDAEPHVEEINGVEEEEPDDPHSNDDTDILENIILGVLLKYIIHLLLQPDIIIGDDKRAYNEEGDQIGGEHKEGESHKYIHPLAIVKLPILLSPINIEYNGEYEEANTS
jgi:hypothetical protein